MNFCFSLYLTAKSVKWLRVLNACASSFVSVTFHFTEKFDCDILFSPKVNFVLSVISIITTFVKLSQIILGYINRRCVCRSDYIFERYAFHMIILLLSPTAQWDVVVLLFGETSKRGAEQKLKRKHLNLGRHKAIFL